MQYIVMLAVAGLDHRMQRHEAPVSLVLLGGIFVVGGFVILFHAFRANSFAISTVRVEPAQKTVIVGPYAVVRHPVYTGSLCMLLGTPFALRSIDSLVIAITTVPVFILRLLHEERLLADRLPDYRQYLLNVRWRLLPFMY